MSRKRAELLRLIDSEALTQDLAEYAQKSKGQEALRAQLLKRLKAALVEGRERAEKKLLEDGKGYLCAQRLSMLQDELLTAIYDFALANVFPVSNPSAAERISIVAVGGYGRETLAPGSDIDLLFVLPYKQTPWGESMVEYMLYMLWDLGQKVGHATRSVDECLRLSERDTTIRTALLDGRYLAGDHDLFVALKTAFDKKFPRGAGANFIAEKLAERDTRHQRAGQSRYVVEPNVKDGKGGLRDLDTLSWISKYVYRRASLEALVEENVFTRREVNLFRRCESFLWSVRCNLHFMTRRAEERLTFDVQQDLAHRLGYTAHPGLRGVERFMKHYFLMAKEVGGLTRTLCAALELRHVKEAPSLSRVMRPFKRIRGRYLKNMPGFSIRRGRLTVKSEQVFGDDPVNLIRLFWLGHRYDIDFHPDALRGVRHATKKLDKNLRNDAEANRLFLDILTSAQGSENVLRQMNETGILGWFVPDFGRIVSLMQFNMYHHYTVDEHLLRAVGFVAAIERGEYRQDHPLSNDIIHKISNRRVLYVAMFLHDIAKGRPQPHAIAGAKVARRLCPRFGMTDAETETVAWLVEYHLLMSNVAQSRDLNDPKTIIDFAQIVQSPERLKLLLLLTVADIRAVGPGVWNGWKGQLLRTLYRESEPLLDGGHIMLSRADQVRLAQEKFTAALPDWSDEAFRQYLGRHLPSYWINVPLDRKLAHARMIDEADRDNKLLACQVRTDPFQEMTELTVYTRDTPKTLVLVAGSCAAAGANIVSAQIYTTTDGQALDNIIMNRQFSETEDELDRSQQIANLLGKALRGEIDITELVAPRRVGRGRLRAFKVAPQVIISNSWSNEFTAIEVNGLDRPGLLYDLTNALSELSLDVASAHITTFGERVVDVFYVRKLRSRHQGYKITNIKQHDIIRHQLLAVLDGNERPAEFAAEQAAEAATGTET